jgi:hypothetical protein
MSSPPMQRTAEGAAVTERLIGIAGEDIRLLKFSMISVFSYESIMNDDTGALGSIAEAFAMSAAAAEANLFSSTLLANPTAADGSAFFSTAHANLAATPGALDATRLENAIQLLRSQTSPAGVNLNLSPYVVLVGPQMERQAMTLIQAMTAPGTTPLRLVVDAAITDKRHYVFADPAIRPAFFRGRLRGMADGPEIQQKRMPFESDGVSFKALMTFCIGLGDPRACVLTTES